MAKVKDIAMQIRGVSYHPEDLHDNLDEDSVVLLRANNIKDGKLILDDVVYVSKSKVAEQQYLQTGDILICASSGSKELVGKAAFVDSVKNPMTFGAFCKVVRPQPEYSEYLGHYFNSPVYRRKISALSAGANINNIKNEHIDNLDIQLVDEKERREIITILNKLNMLISLRKQQLAKLDELVKARFVEMFGDVLLNSMQWPEKTLESMADIVSGITKGRKTAEAALQEVPYMAVSNVKDGYIDWTTVKTILATRQEIEQYRLMPDDILMTEGGDPDKVGRGAIIKVPLKNSIHQNHIFRVRLDEQEVLPSFFAEYLRHQKAKRYFLGCAKQTTGIASINMRQLRALPTLVPPLSLQNQFAAFVERVDQQRQTVQQSLEKLELMKKALMQEYFG